MKQVQAYMKIISNGFVLYGNWLITHNAIKSYNVIMLIVTLL